MSGTWQSESTNERMRREAVDFFLAELPRKVQEGKSTPTSLDGILGRRGGRELREWFQKKYKNNATRFFLENKEFTYDEDSGHVFLASDSARPKQAHVEPLKPASSNEERTFNRRELPTTSSSVEETTINILPSKVKKPDSPEVEVQAERAMAKHEWLKNNKEKIVAQLLEVAQAIDETTGTKEDKVA